MFYRSLTMVFIFLGASWAQAGDVEIVGVKAQRSPDGSYTFSVTLKHGDTGWKHYANKWEVVAGDGKILGTRVLYHPHVHEQPFERSLSGVQVPAGLKFVMIRAYDSVHGEGPKPYRVPLPQ